MIKKYKLGFYNPFYTPLTILLEFLIGYFVWFNNINYAIGLAVFYAFLPFLLFKATFLLNDNFIYHLARGHYIYNNDVTRPVSIKILRKIITLAMAFMLLHLLSTNLIYTFYVIAVLYAFRFFVLYMFYKISKNMKGHNDWVLFLNSDL